MTRATWLLLSALVLAVAGFSGPPAGAQDGDPVVTKPTNIFVLLQDKHMGEWRYVATANGRKIGTLRMGYKMDEEAEKKRYFEEEQRRSAVGRSEFKREPTFERLHQPTVQQSFTANVGAYKYESNPFTLEPGMTAGVKRLARIRSGTAPLVEFSGEQPFPPGGDEVMRGMDLSTPIYTASTLRLMPRLAEEKPEYVRKFLLMEFSEPKQSVAYVPLSLGQETTEELTVDGRKANCQVYVLRSDKDVVGRYWVHPKGYLAKFTEKLYYELEVTYTLGTSAETSAALEEAGKFGADLSSPEATALRWVKAGFTGDQAGWDAVVDAARIEEFIGAMSPDRQEHARKFSNVAGVKTEFLENTCEHLLRFAYHVRMDGDARATVVLPALTGQWQLKMEKTAGKAGDNQKAADTWKIVGILPLF